MAPELKDAISEQRRRPVSTYRSPSLQPDLSRQRTALRSLLLTTMQSVLYADESKRKASVAQLTSNISGE